MYNDVFVCGVMSTSWMSTVFASPSLDCWLWRHINYACFVTVIQASKVESVLIFSSYFFSSYNPENTLFSSIKLLISILFSPVLILGGLTVLLVVPT